LGDVFRCDTTQKWTWNHAAHELLDQYQHGASIGSLGLVGRSLGGIEMAQLVRILRIFDVFEDFSWHFSLLHRQKWTLDMVLMGFYTNINTPERLEALIWSGEALVVSKSHNMRGF